MPAMQSTTNVNELPEYTDAATTGMERTPEVWLDRSMATTL